MTAAQESLKEIQAAVDALEKLVARSSTVSVVGSCFTFYVTNWNPGQGPPETMLSPARQISFLLGKLLATPEPTESRAFGKDDWAAAEHLLNSAFAAYAGLYYPDPESHERPSEEWLRVREVVMPAFLNYFNTGRFASIEQTSERIRRYLSPFDKSIRDTWGLTSSEALSIAKHIADELQGALDRLSATAQEERRVRLALLDRARFEGWSMEQLRAAPQQPEYRKVADEMLSELISLGFVRREQLRLKFPETADAYWRTFSVSRGSGPALTFPTERTVFDDRPLVVVDTDEAMLPVPVGLFSAILDVGERLLSTGPERKRFFRSRDKVLEVEAEQPLMSLVGKAEVFRNVFETPNAQFEHDLVVVTERLCLVVEAKASSVVEPFRDPEKAFQRLRHAFRAEEGIQHGYDQAIRLWRRVNQGEDVTLYDQRGAQIGLIPGAPHRVCYCVCVTRDSHGPLATDLAILLEKAVGEPYPWVPNVLDLQAIAEMWRFLGWGADELAEYLRDRIRLHGKAFSTDELDYVGFFVRHGGLREALDAPGDKLFLDPSYSGVFDELYHHLQHGAPKPDFTPKPAVMTDARKALEGSSVGGETSEAKHVARNAPCPCGSGKRFKKCCARKR
jgi:hypothetical protein